jgi:DNA-binding MarR family transcriptional regulator
MGIIVQGKGLWKALFTRTQRRVLGLLFGHPERSFYANEIVRLAGVGTGAVQRELRSLSQAGLFTVTRVGNQKHYQANPDCPIYPEIRSLVVKTFGALDEVRRVVQELGEAVELAFLYGPEAEALASPGSTLKLMLVSPGLQRQDLETGLEEAGQRIGRAIRLTLLRPERFGSLLEEGEERLQAILREPRIVLVDRGGLLSAT